MTTLERIGRPLEELQAYVDDHPELRRATYAVPHASGVVGRAANMALHVAGLLGGRPVQVAFSDAQHRAAS
jgi:hypothetical protein